MQNVTVKTYSLAPYDYGEIYRYSGAKNPSQNLKTLVDECVLEAQGKILGKACYSTFPVVEGGALDLGCCKIQSDDLSKALKGCSKAVVFGATIGLDIDRLILKYAQLSPAKALIFQAIGAERIECLCNQLCFDLNAELKGQGKTLSPRFSPGYGDLPLQAQTQIFSALNLPKYLGLTLNGSLIMSPTKSVTAIVGVKDGCADLASEGCANCNNKHCSYRKTEE